MDDLSWTPLRCILQSDVRAEHLGALLLHDFAQLDDLEVPEAQLFGQLLNHLLLDGLAILNLMSVIPFLRLFEDQTAAAFKNSLGSQPICRLRESFVLFLQSALPCKPSPYISGSPYRPEPRWTSGPRRRRLFPSQTSPCGISCSKYPGLASENIMQ